MECVQTLLRLEIIHREEESLEALCTLLTTTGKKLSAPNMKLRQLFPQYFDKISRLKHDGCLTSRTRYMLMELVDLSGSHVAKNRKRRRLQKFIKTSHKRSIMRFRGYEGYTGSELSKTAVGSRTVSGIVKVTYPHQV